MFVFIKLVIVGVTASRYGSGQEHDCIYLDLYLIIVLYLFFKEFSREEGFFFLQF